MTAEKAATARKKSKSQRSLRVPWLGADSPEIDKVIGVLVQEIDKTHSDDAAVALTLKEHFKLDQEFKKAEHSRSPASRYMSAIAKEMGIDVDNTRDSIVIPPIKNRKRAEAKLKAEGRTMHDLGRGRIVFDTPEQLEAFYKLMKRKNKSGVIRGFEKHPVNVMPDTYNDFLAKQRSSGFSGFINFDIEIDLGKGRKGTFEIQLMHRDYIHVCDKQSHYLYDMIRMLDEIPKPFRSEEQEKIIKALVLANSSLFNERAERTGLIKFRENDYPPISRKQLQETNDILDRIRTMVEKLNTKEEWKERTLDAITYSKTSLMNIHLASPENPEPEEDAEPTGAA